MTRNRYVLLACAFAALYGRPAYAQVTANLPVTCNAAGTICTQATPVVNPDGTTISGGGGGGGAVTIANGAAVPIGATTDNRSASIDTTAATLIGLTKQSNYLTTLVNGADGATAPANGIAVNGKDGSGNAQTLAVSTNGGLLPGQAAPTSTRTTLVASTIATIDIARTGRLGLSVTVEATLAANLYICAGGQSGTCSATVYDALVPSGATAGTVYTFTFAPTNAIYAFSTGTPVVVSTSWLAL